jgi:hypothetical protein
MPGTLNADSGLYRQSADAGHQPRFVVLPTNVCGHPYSWEIRWHVSGLGVRWPASISRYSRTLTPANQAARQTLRPSRFRERCIMPGYAAKVGTFRA